MKPIHYILAASIILNVVLFAYVKPFAPFAPRPRTPVVSVKTQPRKPAAQNTSTHNLKYATTEQLAQRLAAMEFPPDIIRFVIARRLFDEWINKKGSALGFRDPRYWQASRLLYAPNAIAKSMEADREMNESLQKFLGVSHEMRIFDFIIPGREKPLPEILRQKYGDMPDEKLRTISEIAGKYDKRNTESMESAAKSGALRDDEEMKKQSMAMERQKRDEIAKLLTPAELFEYDIRTNSRSLQKDTALFNVTEQEFRDMFAVWQKTNDSFDDTKIPPEFATQQERDDYRDAQYRQILGDERYADYLQSRNPAYEALNNIALNNNRPLSAVREVVSVQADITQRAAAIAADATLTHDDRAAQYNALAQEAQHRITQALGQRGYTAYRRNSLNWIQTLESGKPPPAPAK